MARQFDEYEKLAEFHDRSQVKDDSRRLIVRAQNKRR
jgi:hypothetical protein